MQGSLLAIEVESHISIAEITGEWDGREIQFWQEEAAGTQKRRAFIGVDLEKTPGKYEVQVRGKLSDGTALSCSAEVEVTLGNFATESLRVNPQYVEPNPEQIERAKAESARLAAIFESVTPEKLWNGKFRLPLRGAHKSGNFGKRRILNGIPGSPHRGVDFPAPKGTPVHATQRGRVALAEELYFSGNTVVLDHGLGIYTLYGHLSSLHVKTGDMVEAGAVLGKVGTTGRSTGPHLHWGLTVDGAKVNGLDIVKLPQ
jgi:murein DD-endopeptidase MepM/ murein hydrolase activator NlpD